MPPFHFYLTASDTLTIFGDVRAEMFLDS